MEAVAASDSRVDAITLEGDVMRSKGTISGGYMNTARSKILTHKRVGVAHLCQAYMHGYDLVIAAGL